MRVIVTTGGTSEPIDDVRAVTNFSTGRFGIAIAEAFTNRGARTTVLGSRLALAQCREDRSFLTEQFSDTASLQALLAAQADVAGDAVVIHAAAVSDWAPVRQVGKLSSSGDELVVTMRPTAKLIDGLRGAYGQRGFLVGFKLLSGSSQAELVAAAHGLCRRARLNLVVANDLSECRDGQHPVWLVTAEGGAIRVEGPSAAVAERIVAFVMARREVRWSATTALPALPSSAVLSADRSRFEGLVRFAQVSQLLCDTNGNAAARVPAPLLAAPSPVVADEVAAVGVADLSGSPSRTVALLVTPRQVDKAAVVTANCPLAVTDLDAGVVRSHGALKCSIDTSVQARILEARPATTMVLHFHEPFGRAQVRTTFPFPCGAAEEAAEVLLRLDEAGVSGASWNVELVHHGFLLGLDDDGLALLRSQWDRTLEEWAQHLDEVGRPTTPVELLRPIFDGVRIVGCAASTVQGVALYVNAAERGVGLGPVLAAQLRSRFCPIVTVDACEVVDYWSGRGFEPSRGADGVVVLSPQPVRGTDPVIEELSC